MSNELEPTDKAMDSKDEISSDEEEEDSEEEQTSEEGSGDEEEGSGDEEDGSGDESEYSDSSEEEEDRTGYQYEDPGSASDSSGFDSTSESCSICLVRLKNQTIGTPETCDHNFCLECILEWSRNVNTCPVDRQVFNLILARDSLEGVVFKKIPVEDKQLQLQDELAQDVTPCEVCGSGESEDTLLLCDGCDLAYHMACLDTPLSRVPEGDWFCPTCSITIDDKCRVCHSAAREEEMLLCDECNQGYHMDCLVPPLRAIPVADWFCANCAGSSLSEQDDPPATSTNHRSHPTPDRPRRQIARTLVSERVRAAIFRNRRSRRQIISSDSDSEEENIGDSPTAAEAATSTVRRPPIKRKTPVKSRRRKRKPKRRRRKTKAKKSTTKKPRKTRRRRRRKGKRKPRKRKTARTKKSITPSTVKSRLADRMGLSRPPTGKTIPLVRERVEKSLESRRADLGISSLSLLGDRNQLMPCSSDSDGEGMAGHSGSTAIARPAAPRIGHRYSKAALNSRRPITAHRNRILNRSATLKCEPPQCSSPFDLLGGILNDQSLLHTNGQNFQIKSDGSLQAKPDLSKKSLSGHKETSEPRDGEDDSGERSGSSDNRDSGNHSADTTGQSAGTNDTAGDVPVSEESGYRAASDANDNKPDGAGDDFIVNTQHDERPAANPDSSDDDDKKADQPEVPVHSPAQPQRVEGAMSSDNAEDKPSLPAGKKSEEIPNLPDGNNSEDNANLLIGNNPVDWAAFSSVGNKSDETVPQEIPQQSAVDGTCDESPPAHNADANKTQSSEHLPAEVAPASPASSIRSGDEHDSSDSENPSKPASPCSTDVSISVEDEPFPLQKDIIVDPEVDQSAISVSVSHDADRQELLSLVKAGNTESIKDVPLPGVPKSPAKVDSKDTAAEARPIKTNAENKSAEDSARLGSDRRDGIVKFTVKKTNRAFIQRRLRGRMSESQVEEGEISTEEGEIDSDHRVTELPSPPSPPSPPRARVSDHRVAKPPPSPPANDTDSDGDNSDDDDDDDDDDEDDDDGELGLTDDSSDTAKMVPISELPRIPKKRKYADDNVKQNGPSDSHRTVLERVGLGEKQDSYPKWEFQKRERGDRETKETKGSRDEAREGKSEGDSGSHRHKDKYSRDSSDNSKSSSRHRHRKRTRSRSRSRDRSRDKRRRSRSRSRDRLRRKSRDRSRSRDRDRSAERSRHRRRRSRDRSRDRDRERDREKRRRSRSRSPRYSRSSRYGDDSKENRSKEKRDDYRGSVKLFSQSLKEAADNESSSGRKFKLKRNFYQEYQAKSEEERIEYAYRSLTMDAKFLDTSSSSKKASDKSSRTSKSSYRDSSYRDSESEKSASKTEKSHKKKIIPETSTVSKSREKAVFEEDDDDDCLIIKPATPQVSADDIVVIDPDVSGDGGEGAESGGEGGEGGDPSYDPSQPTDTPSPIQLDKSPRISEEPDEAVSPASPASPTPATKDSEPTPTSAASEHIRDTAEEARPAPLISPLQPPIRALMAGQPIPGMRHPMMINPGLMPPPPPPFNRMPPGMPMLMPGRLATQNGMPMMPNGPDSMLPPGHQLMPPPPPPNVHNTIETPPLPLPHKALEEMQHISHLLNAQAKLALLAKPPPAKPPPAKSATSDADQEVFKVPRAPPPLVTSTADNRSSKPSSGAQTPPDTDPADTETTEVIDMDVASPLSDDELLLSWSPPPLSADEPPLEISQIHKGYQEKKQLKTSLKQPADADIIALADGDKEAKYMKKLNRQERVIEEVKLALKPFYGKAKITKEEYKDIMRKAVPKICHSKSGDINPVRIQKYVESYVSKVQKMRKYISAKDREPLKH